LKKNMKFTVFIIAIVCITCSSLIAGLKITPTYKDVAYGPHARNKLDIYLAPAPQPTPVLIFIHGGAFAGGDKIRVIKLKLLKLCLENKISIVSINYRLSKDKDYSFKYSKKTPVPPAFENAARAVQFIRHHAAKYNIDKKRLAVAGGSAGGGLALWLGFYDDMARPNAKDPIRRESTKPVCVVALYAQTTYDQEYISREMIYDGYKIGWINKLFQTGTKQLKSPATKTMRKNVSALDQVDAADNVSVFMCRGNESKVTPEMSQSRFVHNVIFYHELEKKLKAYKVPYELVLNSEYKSGKRKGNVYADALQFLKKAFQMN
jgi:acetyl esterase/lipase